MLFHKTICTLQQLYLADHKLKPFSSLSTSRSSQIRAMQLFQVRSCKIISSREPSVKEKEGPVQLTSSLGSACLVIKLKKKPDHLAQRIKTRQGGQL